MQIVAGKLICYKSYDHWWLLYKATKASTTKVLATCKTFEEMQERVWNTLDQTPSILVTRSDRRHLQSKLQRFSWMFKN